MSTFSFQLDPEVKQCIIRVIERLALAEQELGAAIAELTVADRGDKRMVSERLRKAMVELVSARTSLAALVEPAA